MTFSGNPALTPQPPGYYGPRPLYEGLNRRQKRSALWAGALGLILMNFGAGTLLAVLVVGTLAVAFAGFSASADLTSGLRGFDEFLLESNGLLWIAGAGVVGLVIFAVGSFVSVTILRTGGVPRAWAVTWSAFGISIPAVAVLNGIGGVIGQIVVVVNNAAASSGGATVDSTQGGPDAAPLTALLVALVIVGVALVGLIGALAWWWMAHAFRPRVPVSGAPPLDSADESP